jgi:hypothetical protein
MANIVRDAVKVDRTLGAHANQLTFAPASRSVRTAASGPLGAERYFHVTGAIAPPTSMFFHAHGQSPEPTDAARRLARLFWRKPAHARPPAAWKEEEIGRLTSGIQQVAAHAQRQVLVRKFRENADGVAEAGQGQDTMIAQNQKLMKELNQVGEGAPESLQAAEAFTPQQWHAVAQHVQARCERLLCPGVWLTCLIAV